MAIVKVFPDITLSTVPMESVRFRAATRRAVVEVDDKADRRLAFVFRGVMGMRFTPAPLSYGMAYETDEGVVRSILEDTASAWIADVHEAEQSHQQRPTAGLRHFLFLTEDGLWELLAHACDRKDPAPRRKKESREG